VSPSEGPRANVPYIELDPSSDIRHRLVLVRESPNEQPSGTSRRGALPPQLLHEFAADAPSVPSNRAQGRTRPEPDHDPPHIDDRGLFKRRRSEADNETWPRTPASIERARSVFCYRAVYYRPPGLFPLRASERKLGPSALHRVRTSTFGILPCYKAQEASALYAYGMTSTGDVRVSQRGQMSLPASVRHRWGLDEGGEVGYLDIGDAVILIPGGVNAFGGSSSKPSRRTTGTVLAAASANVTSPASEPAD